MESIWADIDGLTALGSACSLCANASPSTPAQSITSLVIGPRSRPNVSPSAPTKATFRCRAGRVGRGATCGDCRLLRSGAAVASTGKQHEVRCRGDAHGVRDLWGAEGAGAHWPGDDIALLVLIPAIALYALALVVVFKRRTPVDVVVAQEG